MKKLAILFVGMVCLFQAHAFEKESVKGVVVQVLDGNTIVLKAENNEEMKLLLFGVDSPEINQEYGKEAKTLLEKTVLKKCVTAEIQGMDRKGNHLAVVTTVKNVDPRIALLKKGLAWTAEKNPMPELESYRVEAQKKGIGLWKQSEPTPPWTFRRQQTMMSPKSS